jgi:hypothetical protein
MKHTTLRIVLALVLLTGMSMAARAQTFGESGEEPGTITKVGTTSAQFLKLGVGARAIALGGAFVAEASDLSAIYWNPAGLATLPGGAVQFNHTKYLADIDYSVAAFGTRLGRLGTLAASIIYLGSGDMAVRTTAQPDGTGERFSVSNLSIQLGFARSLTDRFSIGTTFKYIREQIWHSSASALAFDVGVLFRTPFDRLRLGASMANFGPKMQMSGRDILFSTDPGSNQSGNVEVVNAEYLMDRHALPLLFRVGVAMDAYTDANHRLLVLVDAAHPNDNSEYVNFGAEYGFRDLVHLRVGHRNTFETDGEQGLTYGGGLGLRLDRSIRAQVNYAYADFGLLEATHWFSFDLSF